jgi:hypothetical protein
MHDWSSKDGVSLSEQAPWRGATSFGTLEDMSRKALDTSISLHRSTCRIKGNLEGGSYTREFEI